MHPSGIQLTRVLKGLLNRLLGNFVEHHPVIAAGVTANRLLQMPRDGFSLAIQVGSEVYGGAVFGQFF